MFRHVAPAGTPMRTVDLLRWASAGVAGRDVAEALATAIEARFDVRHAYLTGTGRAGMTLLLKAMRRLAPPTRNQVILPSYTCYSVAASVVKAGLTIRVVDIDPTTLDYVAPELEGVDCSRGLAIVATNLYGLPNDLPSLARLAGARGVFLIDDAAQAMGASVGGRPSGTWGDAGLFSFDKGKNVSAIDGGVVVTNSGELAEAMHHETASLPSAGFSRATVDIAKAIAYSVLLRPWLYWIPNSIPQLELGKTVFTTEYPLARPSQPLAALALTMIERLEWLTAARVANARRLSQGLASCSALEPIAPRADAVPVYLRLPLLAPTASTRDDLIAALRAVGIGATGSYPDSIAEIADLGASVASPSGAPGGRAVARRILTLPTQPYLSAADAERIFRVVSTLGTAATAAGHRDKGARSDSHRRAG
jgi:perosamine synthetase